MLKENGSFFTRKMNNTTALVLMILVSFGIILHIIPFFYNRSLWLDEAMLASSICTKSFLELVSGNLDLGQSAPLGWLMMIKLFTTLFGTSETILRLWSLLSFFGCIIAIIFLLKDKAPKNLILCFLAIFVLTGDFIYYANELKPYMSDNMFCLLVLLLWQKYQDGKLSLKAIVLLFSVILWFSFSSVFFIAACMIIEIIKSIYDFRRKLDIKRFIIRVGLCLIVFCSFVANYFIWLSKSVDNAGGKDYWDLLSFPLIPKSIGDIKLIIDMAKQFTAFFPRIVIFIIYIMLLLFVYTVIAKKNDCSHLLLPSFLSIVLLLMASGMGFYPIRDRLVQIYMIVILLLCCMSCKEIDESFGISSNGSNVNNLGAKFYSSILLGMIAVFFVLGAPNILPNRTYKSGSEVKMSMKYLEDNMLDDDYVYVYNSSIPVYMYETGYEIAYDSFTFIDDNISLESCDSQNLILGQGLYRNYYEIPYSYDYYILNEAVESDAEKIESHDSVFIFATNGERGIAELIERLDETGKITMVSDYYDTHLYHYSRLN